MGVSVSSGIMFVSSEVMFVSSGVMFAWDLVFYLFTQLASNEREERFLHHASLWFSVLFSKENKILFEL